MIRSVKIDNISSIQLQKFWQRQKLCRVCRANIVNLRLEFYKMSKPPPRRVAPKVCVLRGVPNSNFLPVNGKQIVHKINVIIHHSRGLPFYPTKPPMESVRLGTPRGQRVYPMPIKPFYQMQQQISMSAGINNMAEKSCPTFSSSSSKPLKVSLPQTALPLVMHPSSG